MGEFSSTSTKLIACPCAVTGRSVEKGDIMDIPGTSGPLHTAASSLHRSQNLDLKQKQLFLLINNCSGAQKYPKRKGLEMVPFPWSSDFPNPITNFLLACHAPLSSLFFSKAPQLASVQPVKSCTMNKHAQEMLKAALRCSRLFLQESHHPARGAGFDALALNREFWCFVLFFLFFERVQCVVRRI